MCIYIYNRATKTNAQQLTIKDSAAPRRARPS